MNTSIHQSLNFVNYDTLLMQLDTDLALSEAHGLLVGLLCTKSLYQFNVMGWLHELGEDVPNWDDLDTNTQQEITTLIENTNSQLTDPLYSFMPFLPNDDELLSERTQALGEWCVGFLAGLSLGGYYIDPEAVQNDISEALRDIRAIAKLASDNLGQSEEEEKAFIEVVEYVRVAVLLILNTLSSMRDDKPPKEENCLVH